MKTELVDASESLESIDINDFYEKFRIKIQQTDPTFKQNDLSSLAGFLKGKKI